MSDLVVLHRRCAGLDVHQAQVTACIRVTPTEGKVHTICGQFSTLPSGLRALGEWLRKYQVPVAVMEGTGVYWMPVFAALEAAGIKVTLSNAHHLKNVPGRKTDQSDAAWMAQLLACGLAPGSFVPPAEIRALRELTRERVHRVEDRTHIVNDMHRLLERRGLKLCSVVSDLTGRSAQLILHALASGTQDAKVLSDLAVGKLRCKMALLREVLDVPLSVVDRLLLTQALSRLSLVHEQIGALDDAIAQGLAPYRTQVERLKSVGVIDEVSAAVILSEVGVDMSVFPSGDHLASWAGLCPGNHESAGKRKKVGTRPGNVYLQRTLVQIAMVLSRSKQGHDLTDFFKKKMVRGYKKAAVATARKLLVRIWKMLLEQQDYKAPPPQPITDAQRVRRVLRLRTAIESLGYAVDLHPKAA